LPTFLFTDRWRLDLKLYPTSPYDRYAIGL
jgi:hypothetical protein